MCTHNQTIEDSGSEVCTLCGLVLEPVYHVPLDPVYSQPSDFITFETEFPPESILRNDLLEVLALIHQDSYFIIEKIISFLKTHCSPLPKYSTHSGRSIIAFAIWEILNQHDCPHAPTEIAYLCHISPNDIQHAQRKLNVSSTFCPPSLYAHRFAAYMGLSKRVAVALSRAVQTVDDSMRHPETVVGAVLLNMQDQLVVKRGVQFSNNICLESLAATLKVSAYTIKKMQRDLPVQCRNIISKIVEEMNVSHLPSIEGTLV